MGALNDDDSIIKHQTLMSQLSTYINTIDSLGSPLQ
jgi:hypothetical protein